LTKPNDPPNEVEEEKRLTSLIGAGEESQLTKLVRGEKKSVTVLA
jgi:hypothetical protein